MRLVLLILTFLQIFMYSCIKSAPKVNLAPTTNTSVEGPYKINIDKGLSQGLHTDQSVKVGSINRKFHLFIPESSSDETYPMVVLLHGHGGSSDQMLGLDGKKAPYRVWLDIAETEKVFILVPEGVISPDDKLGWNDCRGDTTTNPSTDDTSFIMGLIEGVADSYSVDRSRLYVSGTSNGGQMTFRLAIEMGSKLAAIAPVVAALPKNSKCKAPDITIPLLLVNGTDDNISPYDGGSISETRGSVLSTMETIDIWNELNQTNSTPVMESLADIDVNDSSQLIKYTYSGDSVNHEVVLLKMQGAGHVEPSISEQYSVIWEAIVGAQNHDIEMARFVWDFFKNKSR